MRVLKGFKDFITRGNVVDLAVGVVIGAAFTSVVGGFTNSFLTPLINLIGTKNVAGFIPLPKGQKLLYGEFISDVIGFAITAAVVYFLVVVPLNKFFRKEDPKSDTPTEETLLLREIRDALIAQNGGSAVPKQETNHATDSGSKVQ